MPKGSVPRRESKKAKKNSAKKQVGLSVSEFASVEPEVIKKRRKPRRDEEISNF